MSRFFWAFVLLVGLWSLSVDGQIIEKACKGTVGTTAYDLTKLANAFATDQICVDQGGNTYYYLPCKVLTTQDCMQAEPTPGACQQDTRRPPLYHDLGSINTAVFAQREGQGEDKGFLLTYTGGEDDRQVDIEFICDTSAGNGQLVCGNPAENPGKHYHLKWTTAHACPSTGDGGDGDGSDGGGDGGKKKDKDDGPAISGGWIFIIILSGLTVLYFVGGAIYNKFVQHKEGIEIIPNVEFWMSLPGLVKDGFLFTYRKIAGLFGRHGGYVEA